MENSFARFIKGFTVYTAVIALISAAIYWWVPALLISPDFLYIILAMYILTLVLIKLLFMSMQDKLSRFVNAFMLVNFGKLILYSVIIFVYAYLSRATAASFVISFFIYYLLFTGYEITVLLRFNK